MSGLYPFQDLKAKDEYYYERDPSSPLRGTPYEKMLLNIDLKEKKCDAGPVMEIPHHADTMFHSRNCKVLHEFLNDQKDELKHLESKFNKEFGELVPKTKAILEKHYNKTINNIKQYFSLVDAEVAERYELDDPDTREF